MNRITSRPASRGGAGCGVWIHLCRVWSLTATLAPIAVVATFNAMCPHWTGESPALAWGAWTLNLVLALVSCGSLQIACNLLNTWGDFRSGVDSPERLPNRPELVNGTLGPEAVLRAALVFVALGSAAGLYLLSRCFSWTLSVYAVLGIAGSVNYSTGIRFKYRGLGVPFVFLLMGVWLMLAADLCLGGKLNGLIASSPSGFALAASILSPICFLVSNILHANDMRDIEDDVEAGIKTFASSLGPRGALVAFRIMHLLPLAGVVSTFILLPKSLGSASPLALTRALPLLLPLLLLPLTIQVLALGRRGLSSHIHQESWKGLLPGTARLHLLFGLLQAVSFLLVR